MEPAGVRAPICKSVNLQHEQFINILISISSIAKRRTPGLGSSLSRALTNTIFRFPIYNPNKRFGLFYLLNRFFSWRVSGRRPTGAWSNADRHSSSIGDELRILLNSRFYNVVIIRSEPSPEHGSELNRWKMNAETSNLIRPFSSDHRMIEQFGITDVFYTGQIGTLICLHARAMRL